MHMKVLNGDCQRQVEETIQDCGGEQHSENGGHIADRQSRKVPCQVEFQLAIENAGVFAATRRRKSSPWRSDVKHEDTVDDNASYASSNYGTKQVSSYKVSEGDCMSGL